MREHDRQLTREDIVKLQRDIPSNDDMGRRLGVGTHYGSIEAVEEKRFPWLKARRRGRRT